MDESAFGDQAFCHRVMCYLDGSITDTELQELNSDLQENAKKRAVFAQLCLLRAALVREGNAMRTASDVAARRSGESFFACHSNLDDADEDAGGEAEETAAPSLEDAVIVPALVIDSDDSDFPEPIRMPPPALPVKARPGKAWWISGMSGAAVLLIALLIWTSMRSSQKPAQVVQVPVIPACSATVTASAAGMLEMDRAVKPGMGLESGELLHLESGALELTLAQGATVVVTAPADLQITNANAIALYKGSVVAHVPPRAHGFRATGPGMVVIDLGTEFGMHVSGSGTASDLSVFTGIVRVTAVDHGERPTGMPVLLAADHAVRHDQSDASAPAPIAFDPSSFNRTIEQVRFEVPTHGTGEGIASGSADPRWQILSVAGDPNWVARPAVVLTQLSPTYASNTPQASWVSLEANPTNVLPGEYVYQTSIDLTGFDPKTVSSNFIVAVDDSIHAIKVNDISTDVMPDDIKSYQLQRRTLPFTSHAWRAGVNKITVVVLNRNDGSVIGRNPTGLQLRWVITAQPEIER